MIVVESIVGNAGDELWQQQLTGAVVDYLELDQWQAQKNRFRKTTAQGKELAVSLERNTYLRNGDILLWDAENRQVVLAKIALPDVLAFDLTPLLTQPDTSIAQTYFELGHMLGNQHWPAVVKGAKVFVPLTIAWQAIASVMKTQAFSGITYEFIPGAEVLPVLAPYEVALIFGGLNSAPHSHHE